MALATVEVPRRNSNGDATGAVILAAEPLNPRRPADMAKLEQTIVNDRLLARKAWEHFDQIGEVHYALTRAAKIAGYSRFKAVRFSPDGKEIESEIESGLPAEIVASIYSRVGGLRGLVERYFLQQKVAAESHLIVFRESDRADADGYQFVSSRELSTAKTARAGLEIQSAARENDLVWQTAPTSGVAAAGFTRKVLKKDYLGRVWSPSPAYLDVPESPLNALDVQCDLLHDMTLVMSATMKSRFALGGILFWPASLRDVLSGKAKTSDSVSALDVLDTIMKRNAQASDNSTAVAPILTMGPDEAGEKIRHITLDRQILETDLTLRAELIDRILFGLDIVAPATKSGEDLNHFGAWQASADEIRLAVIPDVEALSWVFNRLILQPRLAAENYAGAGRIGVWYDLSEASVRANRQGDAKIMRDEGLLADLPTLKAAGWKESDLLIGDERVRWVGKTLRSPYLALWGTPEHEMIDWSMVDPSASGRIGDNPGGDPPAGPGVGDPGSPDDEDTDRPESEKPI